MTQIITETILERTVNGIDMVCGYNKLPDNDDFTPFIDIGGEVTQFDDITEARSAFWKAVKG